MQPTGGRLNSPSPLRITVLYDNRSTDPALKEAWGFSALLEQDGLNLLFDTGGDSPTLLKNMAALGISPTQIQRIFLSHFHEDHTDGLAGLIQAGAQPEKIYFLAATPEAYKARFQALGPYQEITAPAHLIANWYTTGEISENTPEHALITRFPQSQVLLTGCAHPGIVRVTQRAYTQYSAPFTWVGGGFHLKDASAESVDHTLAELNALPIQTLSPAHCTGDSAIAHIQASLGQRARPLQVGAVLEFAP